MSQFPNMLPFDLETYTKTGNVREAANVGLGRLGMLMAGQDAWGMPNAQLSAVGANFWSGDLVGLDLPNNPMDPTYSPNSPPTQPTGSFVSISHAIDRRGLTCLDCHSESGVMDYTALGYTPDQVNVGGGLLVAPWQVLDFTNPAPRSTDGAIALIMALARAMVVAGDRPLAELRARPAPGQPPVAVHREQALARRRPAVVQRPDDGQPHGPSRRRSTAGTARRCGGDRSR